MNHNHDAHIIESWIAQLLLASGRVRGVARPTAG